MFFCSYTTFHKWSSILKEVFFRGLQLLAFNLFQYCINFSLVNYPSSIFTWCFFGCFISDFRAGSRQVFEISLLFLNSIFLSGYFFSFDLEGFFLLLTLLTVSHAICDYLSSTEFFFIDLTLNVFFVLFCMCWFVLLVLS